MSDEPRMQPSEASAFAECVFDNFQADLKGLIRRYHIEEVSNTPVEIVAGVMIGSLTTYNAAITQRDQWYDHSHQAWRDRTQYDLFDRH